MNTLKSEDKIDKGIPGLDEACIKYILEHKQCICGAEVIEGTNAYKKLTDLENYIPPVSIGTQINTFKNKIEDINRNALLVYKNVKNLREKLVKDIATKEKSKKKSRH